MTSTLRKRVLVVEDDSLVTRAISRALERAGYDVAATENGRTALEWLRRANGRLPDLILLDWRMPVMDGAGFLREKEKDPTLKRLAVLVMSGDPGTKAEAKKFGIDHWVQKPLGRDALLASVKGRFE